MLSLLPGAIRCNNDPAKYFLLHHEGIPQENFGLHICDFHFRSFMQFLHEFVG
jgi:hypothetical protein